METGPGKAAVITVLGEHCQLQELVSSPSIVRDGIVALLVHVVILSLSSSLSSSLTQTLFTRDNVGLPLSQLVLISFESYFITFCSTHDQQIHMNLGS